MSSLGGIQQGREAVPQRRHGLGRLIHGKRRLRQPDHLGRIADVDGAGPLRPVHETNARGRLPGGADHLFVALVADEQNVIILRREAPGFVVHLGDERARRIDHLKAALLGIRANVRRDPMGGEHHHRTGRDVRVLVHEHRTALLQGSHHVQVVDDLLADVDGGAVALERHLDRLHGPVDTGTVAAWLGEEDTPGGRRHVTHVRRGQPGRTRPYPRGGRAGARRRAGGDQGLTSGNFALFATAPARRQDTGKDNASMKSASRITGLWHPARVRPR